MINVDSAETVGASALDKALIARHRQRRPGFLERLINAYLDEAPKYAKAVRTSIPVGDWEGLKIAAHTLKSSTANVGAVRLSAICLKLEHAVATKSSSEAGEQLARFNMEYFEVEEALKALLMDLRKAVPASPSDAQPHPNA